MDTTLLLLDKPIVIYSVITLSLHPKPTDFPPTFSRTTVHSVRYPSHVVGSDPVNVSRLIISNVVNPTDNQISQADKFKAEDNTYRITAVIYV